LVIINEARPSSIFVDAKGELLIARVVYGSIVVIKQRKARYSIAVDRTRIHRDNRGGSGGRKEGNNGEDNDGYIYVNVIIIMVS